ncbi:dihydrofolate reductase family protein [Patescibacteria group bacterium]|nr:dihydrofolate reductase family protein [Patescibacteria group bacterium]
MQVTLIAAMSADGKIAEEKDQVSLDWTSKEDTGFFVKKTKEIGVVIMGRNTYETIGRPLKDRLNVIMTRDLDGRESEPGVLEWTSDSPVEIIESLAKRGYDKVALCGGASVYSAFLQQGLVDDLYLTVEPVLFGKGIPLASGFDRIDLDLIDSVLLGEQSVLIHYRVKK